MEDSIAQSFVKELQRELSPEHSLFGKPVVAVARRIDRDDVLFRFGESPERYAVVHLTWTGKQEGSRQWPRTEIFDSLGQFTASNSN
jgi:hypothetical protein